MKNGCEEKGSHPYRNLKRGILFTKRISFDGNLERVPSPEMSKLFKALFCSRRSIRKPFTSCYSNAWEEWKIFEEDRKNIEAAGHCLGFHSFDHPVSHRIRVPGKFASSRPSQLLRKARRRIHDRINGNYSPQLDTCRRVDCCVPGVGQSFCAW